MRTDKYLIFKIFNTLIYLLVVNLLYPQTAMTNIQGRHTTSLNGKWQVIVDPVDAGQWRQFWMEKKPEKKTDFFEYSFDGGPALNVPSDFNTQMPELAFYEGTVWYKKTFECTPEKNKRIFLHFGAVNYIADVYLNGKLLGSHEGGFTPFQFEITGDIIPEKNSLVVMVNNKRLKDGIPGLGYDWLNYGGITRDANLVETNSSFIEDYFIQLKKHSLTDVLGWVKVNGNKPVQKITVRIPELNLVNQSSTNSEGMASIKFSSKFKLWSPENPKLYKLIIESETDTITEEIGFRSIETKGAQILLNEKPIFLKGVNIHEENPQRAARAYSEADAVELLSWAKELGCNFVRLAHYPHNEYMVRTAEKMGILVWDEIPVYQHIEFAATGVPKKISKMLNEMMQRDKNRCAVFIWCISNETYPTTPNRDNALIELTKQCRQLDSTRLVTSVICTQKYENNSFDIWDPLYKYCDIVAINEYLGWYVPWQGAPDEVKWKLVCNDKPVIISEFGGEALYGNNQVPKDEANYWSEEYQEQIYKDQIKMFNKTPNLCGVCPWLLVDYRSMTRLQPIYQQGWNRKGLISDRGEKKKAWYVMKKYYEGIKNQ